MMVFFPIVGKLTSRNSSLLESCGMVCEFIAISMAFLSMLSRDPRMNMPSTTTAACECGPRLVGGGGGDCF